MWLLGAQVSNIYAFPMVLLSEQNPGKFSHVSTRQEPQNSAPVLFLLPLIWELRSNGGQSQPWVQPVKKTRGMGNKQRAGEVNHSGAKEAPHNVAHSTMPCS